MEEKERYTIESFEIEEPSVIFDNKTNQIILTLVDYNDDEITHLKDLLNHYFNRIKELEEKIEIQNNKEELIAENEAMKDTLAVVFAQKRNIGQANEKLREENQQLKQQLHDLPKKIVEEIRDVLNGNDIEIQDNIYFTDILDTILKKYGGENESK